METTNFKKIDFRLESPDETREYFTDKGYLRYDYLTKSFYDSDGSTAKVNYWFKEITTFDEASHVVIEYLCKNHHPHTTVMVTPTSAELLEGVKSTGEVLDYIPD